MTAAITKTAQSLTLSIFLFIITNLKPLVCIFNMDKKLDVFLSSNANEFGNERKHLSKKISKIPFLECILLEDGGPMTQNTVLTSLKEVRKCDILVGILGDHDSQTTRKEIKEAYTEGKYCLIYLKKTKSKNEKMNKFITEFIVPNLVYHEFKEKKNLYSKITDHLRDHLYDILSFGLECFKKEQKELMAKSEKTEIETRAKIEKKNHKAKDVLQEAKKSLGNGDYLASVLMCGISLELALKEWLIKSSKEPTHLIENSSMGILARMIQKEEMMDHRSIHNMMEINMMRNQAVHGTRMPDGQSAETAMNRTEKLLEKLRI